MTMTGEQYPDLAASVETPRIAKDGVFACPCCDGYSFSEAGGYEICDVCGWEDDPVQAANADLAGGANGVRLIEARENYRMTNHSDPVRRDRRLRLV
jgi:alkyl hydroperoxide reductase subunit AhpF